VAEYLGNLFNGFYAARVRDQMLPATGDVIAKLLAADTGLDIEAESFTVSGGSNTSRVWRVFLTPCLAKEKPAGRAFQSR